jgi:hypothetical protein
MYLSYLGHICHSSDKCLLKTSSQRLDNIPRVACYPREQEKAHEDGSKIGRINQALPLAIRT